MQARNSHVKEGLQSAYASKVPGEMLDVFCVSNVMYEKYSEKGNTELVQASCIPDLRQFCYGITADAQLRETLHFLRSSLPALLNSLDLWVSDESNVARTQEAGLDESIFEILDSVTLEVGIEDMYLVPLD
jgi:hypothetical protein